MNNRTVLIFKMETVQDWTTPGLGEGEAVLKNGLALEATGEVGC